MTTDIMHEILLNHTEALEASKATQSSNLVDINNAASKHIMLENQVRAQSEELNALREEVKTLSLSLKSLEDHVNQDSNRSDSLADKVNDLKDKNLLPGRDSDAICNKICDDI